MLALLGIFDGYRYDSECESDMIDHTKHAVSWG